MDHINDHMNRIEIPIAFETIFRDHFKALCYFAFQFTKDMDEAEDVVQDAFIKFWDLREKFMSEPAIKSFLYVSVRNACLNNIRHKLVIQKYVEIQPADYQTHDPEILNKIVEAEVLSSVYKAVKTLPDGCRKIFELSYFEELKNPQIAVLLQVTVNTVKTQKYRAIKILSTKLKHVFKTQVLESTLLAALFYFF